MIKYGASLNYVGKGCAEIGKEYIFSDNWYEIENEPEICTRGILYAIAENNPQYPFEMKDSGDGYQFIREIEEEFEVRCYKSCKEFISDYKAKMAVIFPEMNMPMIWLKSKNNPSRLFVIDGYEDDLVHVGNTWYGMNEIFLKFTYLDDSPCGILKEMDCGKAI